MLAHAFAPKMPPPALWAKSTWVKELGVTWDDLGGIDLDEIALLAELSSIWHEAQALKQRVQSKQK